jgi:hypothetical protein
MIALIAIFGSIGLLALGVDLWQAGNYFFAILCGLPALYVFSGN